MPTIKGPITFGKNMSEADKAKYRKALGRDKKRSGMDIIRAMVKGEVHEGKEKLRELQAEKAAKLAPKKKAAPKKKKAAKKSKK